MLKLTGCVLIFISCVGLGAFSAGKEAKKYEELKELYRIFYLLKGELEYTHVPLELLFGQVATHLDSPYREWFLALSVGLKERKEKEFARLWERKLRTYLSGLSLKEGEYLDLTELGERLGQTDLKTGVGVLEWYLKQLELKIGTCREALSVKRRLYYCTGITGGLFLVLLFL